MNRRDFQWPAIRSLLGLEFRRVRKQVLHTLGGSLAVVTVMVLADFGSSAVFVLLGAIGFSFALMGPMHVMKDKLDGTMEFLAGLPASPASLAAARCAAAGALTALGAFFVTAACGIALPPILDVPAIRVVAVAYPLSWFSASAASWLLMGLMARFTIARLASTGFAVPFVVLIGALWVFDALFGNPVDLLADLMARDSGLSILILAVLLLSTIVMAASYLLTRGGIARYRPEPDKVDW